MPNFLYTLNTASVYTIVYTTCMKSVYCRKSSKKNREERGYIGQILVFAIILVVFIFLKFFSAISLNAHYLTSLFIYFPFKNKVVGTILKSLFVPF